MSEQVHRPVDVARVVAALYEQEWPFVLAAAARIAGDLDLAEECAQDAFAQALSRWPKVGIPDRPGAWLAPHGEGRVLVIADPALWTHRGLARRDNVLLLYNVARLAAADGRVFFDEYHHGIRSGGGYWDYLRYHDLHWLVLQLAAVVGMAAWSVAVRLGPARATPPAPVRG